MILIIRFTDISGIERIEYFKNMVGNCIREKPKFLRSSNPEKTVHYFINNFEVTRQEYDRVRNELEKDKRRGLILK